MTNLQLIEALCGLVENLVRIVKALATKLEQVKAPGRGGAAGS